MIRHYTFIGLLGGMLGLSISELELPFPWGLVVTVIGAFVLGLSAPTYRERFGGS